MRFSNFAILPTFPTSLSLPFSCLGFVCLGLLHGRCHFPILPSCQRFPFLRPAHFRALLLCFVCGIHRLFISSSAIQPLFSSESFLWVHIFLVLSLSSSVLSLAIIHRIQKSFHFYSFPLPLGKLYRLWHVFFLHFVGESPRRLALLRYRQSSGANTVFSSVQFSFLVIMR